ncbi:NAD-dependent protein deacetylase sirtuin-2 [Spiromyces aspiralis]|uniref:NAD-dependent protein deacetylase sirtuin-2 n=1 Tax=Spiromyces aspiralis TaxID=68401 RepID=A0ACC1HL20_9FUNG|nr:NAD-dependent protein deacetylase sirtuin-2 [Spiromyces aspiralis]
MGRTEDKDLSGLTEQLEELAIAKSEVEASLSAAAIVVTDAETETNTPSRRGSNAETPDKCKDSSRKKGGSSSSSILSPSRFLRRSPRRQKIISIIENNSLESIAKLIKSGRARNIILMTGAGISTSAGIPDFRSPKTGLYANLQRFNLPYPEAIFDMEYFLERPEPFYVLAKELYPGNFKPTVSHMFARLLQDKGVLLRHFTQNIDTLERIAGVDEDKLVEAHGSFYTGHCISLDCREQYSQEWMRDLIFADRIPHCERCGSLVKPDITFFGEALPSRFFECADKDFGDCDLLIVMGTSLQVYPFAALINYPAGDVPRLLINRERVGDSMTRGVGFDFDMRNGGFYRRDAIFEGDCDVGCLRLIELLEWEENLKALMDEFESRPLATSTKSPNKAAVPEAAAQQDNSSTTSLGEEEPASLTKDETLADEGGLAAALDRLDLEALPPTKDNQA